MVINPQADFRQMGEILGFVLFGIKVSIQLSPAWGGRALIVDFWVTRSGLDRQIESQVEIADRNCRGCVEVGGKSRFQTE